MTVAADLIHRLRRQGVTIADAGGRLVLDGPNAVLTEAVLAELKSAKADVLAVLEKERRAVIDELGQMPPEHRSRVAWLARLGRRAGLDAEGVFAVIDEMFPGHVTGPYALKEAELRRVADRLRAEIGTRPPIPDPVAVPPRPPSPPLPGETSALELKRGLGWSDARFSAFCQRVIGKVGLTSAAEDRLVRAAMEREARP